MCHEDHQVDRAAAPRSPDDLTFGSLMHAAGLDRLQFSEELCLHAYAFTPVPVEGLHEGEMWRRPGGGLVTRERAFALIRRWVANGGGLPFPDGWRASLSGGERS